MIVIRQVDGREHRPEQWQSIEIDWHPAPVTAVPTTILLLVLLMRRSPALALDRACSLSGRL
jgi:hypothetical protein